MRIESYKPRKKQMTFTLKYDPPRPDGSEAERNYPFIIRIGRAQWRVKAPSGQNGIRNALTPGPITMKYTPAVSFAAQDLRQALDIVGQQFEKL